MYSHSCTCKSSLPSTLQTLSVARLSIIANLIASCGTTPKQASCLVANQLLRGPSSSFLSLLVLPLTLLFGLPHRRPLIHSTWRFHFETESADQQFINSLFAAP
ncbi:hypothetical protein CH063_03775 [Colletotrichum higginsianum]|uniref:Uncharacterized protein n=1 Tax=Colletotrichum higginsianum (strain IMI 349063) TaxID=759273 RepID=H1W0Q5_COLHI|nr:hypothetical protein CH063_03775 [Colletotrichum higginsianum]